MRETDATANVPWLALSPDENGAIEVRVTANSLPAPRTGTTTIVGSTLTVIQNGTIQQVRAESGH
jgi:hypothetical protein